MLHEAPSIDVVLPNFQTFIGNEIIVGHNVNFDINFLYDNFINVIGVSFKNGNYSGSKLTKQL